MSEPGARKAEPLEGQDGEINGWLIFCPGCKCGHLFTTRGHPGNGNGACWTFNGNPDEPTFSPSMLVNKSMPERRCHSFVEGGKIRFLQDCYHELAGQTVELGPAWAP